VEKTFWKNLDIPVNDILDLKFNGRPKYRLEKKLENSSGWLEIINSILKTKHNSLKDLIKYLYKSKNQEFFNIYFLIVFASKINTNVIKNRIPTEILKKYEKQISNGTISYTALLIHKHQ